MPDTEDGYMTLFLSAEPGNMHFSGRSQIRAHYIMDGRQLRIDGWQVEVSPRPRTPKRPRFEPHEKISKPVVAEREMAGREMRVHESDLVALDHLKDTPEELRTEIDDLVADLINLETRGFVYPRAVNRLKTIGRPAIPRILNQIYELHGDLDANNLQLNRLVRCLRMATGAAFAYPVTDHTVQDVKATAEQRLSSLRQWFAFWYRYHKGEYDALIDKRDNLEDPPVVTTPPVKKKTL